MKKAKPTNKFFAALITFVMCLVILPSGVFADGLKDIQNVEISPDGILTWDPFEGVAQYKFWCTDGFGVYILNPSVKTINLNRSFKSANRKSGIYTITLQAYDNNGNVISNKWTGTYTYSAPTISTITLSGYKDPLPNENKDTPERLTVPDGGHYKIKRQEWTAPSHTVFYTLTRNESYSLYIVLLSLDGYKFDKNITPDDIDIPGVSVREVSCNENENELYIYTEYRKCHNPYVNDFVLTGITPPVAGTHPNMTVLPKSDAYTVTDVQWKRTDKDERNLQTYDTFQPDATYQCSVYLKINYNNYDLGDGPFSCRSDFMRGWVKYTEPYRGASLYYDVIVCFDFPANVVNNSIEYDTSSKTVQISSALPHYRSKAILAAYKDGKLLKSVVRDVDILGGEVTSVSFDDFDCDTADTFKVMAWDSTSAMTPLLFPASVAN